MTNTHFSSLSHYAIEDKFLLDDDDPAVMKELDRRRSVRARADQPKEPEKNQKKDTAGDKGTTEEKEKDQSKWQATHQELAEKRAQTNSKLVQC